MAARGFVCNRFPSLKIGDRIEFQNGLFVTDDLGLQEQIERNEWYGIHIHPRETQEEIAATEATTESQSPPAPAEGAEPEPPRVRHGRRGTK